MKKWILKKEIVKILETYSIRKDEFQQMGEMEYCYVSSYVKGYMVTLSEELYSDTKTGRIIVFHTQSNGKRTFQDVWERDRDGNLQFRFRNPWNLPLSDADYIKDLEEQNERLKVEGKILQKELEALKSQKINNDTKPDIMENEQRIAELKAELEKLQKHNARGAGRKPSKSRMDAVKKVKSMLDAGISDVEIMEKLQISRATFYRYKRSIRN